MAEESYPWQSGSGTAVDEARWQSMANRYLPSGVIGSTRTTADTSLQPSIPAGGGGPTFEMTSGAAFILGVKYDNTATLSKTSSNNASGDPRVDRMVLVMDRSAKTITADILVGTPAASPSPPALSPPPANTTYLAIARATVAGGGSSYSNMVDERMYLANRTYAAPSTGFGAGFSEGDLLYQTDTDRWFQHNGTTLVDLATVLNGTSVFQRASAFSTTTSAVYTTMTGDPAIAFTAPASGKVWIHFGARTKSGAAAVQSLMAPEVRTGASIGGGSIVYTANDDDSVGSGNTQDGSGSRSILVPGLTAGAAYHARAAYRRNGGTGTDTAGFAGRTIGVQPTT